MKELLKEVELLAKNPLNAELRVKLLNDAHPIVRARTVALGNLSPIQRSSALADSDNAVRVEVIKLGGLSTEEVMSVLISKSSSLDEKIAAIEHSSKNGFDGGMLVVQIAMADKNGEVREAALTHWKVSFLQRSAALLDPDWFVRAAAVNGELNRQQISSALADISSDVRCAAVRSGQLSDSQFNLAMIDGSWNVRATAIKYAYCDLTAEQLSAALNDKFSQVRAMAVARGVLSDEQYEMALADESWLVRIAAVKLDRMSPDQTMRALNDPVDEISLYAQNTIHAKVDAPAAV